MKSSREAMIEANKHSLSAHSVLESDEGKIVMTFLFPISYFLFPISYFYYQ